MTRGMQLWGSVGLFFFGLLVGVAAASLGMMGIAMVGFLLMPVAALSMMFALFRRTRTGHQLAGGPVVPVEARASTSKQGSSAVGAVLGIGVLLFLLYQFGLLPAGIGGGYRLAQFNQVTTGMTVGQVRSIMGDSGELSVDSSVAGYSGQIYTWKNAGGGNMIVQFQNGKVITKAQAGLR